MTVDLHDREHARALEADGQAGLLHQPRLRGGAIDQYGAAEGLASQTVWPVFRDRQGNLWAGSNHGQLYFVRGIWGFSLTLSAPPPKMAQLSRDLEIAWHSIRS